MADSQYVESPVTRLERAREQRELISVERSVVGADTLVGHVVAVGEQWVVLSVSDTGSDDGWVAVRIVHISMVGSPEGARFLQRGRERQSCWPPQSPPHPLSLSSGTNALIQSAAAGFPLVTLLFEGQDPASCLIGRPGRLRRGLLLWEELTPSGEWSADGRRCELARVTRVEVGGQYQRALAHVSYLRSLLDPEWHQPTISLDTPASTPEHTDSSDPNLLLG